MRLYKYRDLSGTDPKAMARLESVLRNQAFWAAAANTLNDPLEFEWSCDYEATSDTTSLLARVLTAYRRMDLANASQVASLAVSSGRLATVAEPVIQSVISQLRTQVGLICFGRSPRNHVLWQRYGGSGNGVAIELEVEDSLYGSQLRDVTYVQDKRVHVDMFLRASLDEYPAAPLFNAALLAKPQSWAEEDEVRFVSKRHSIAVHIQPSRIRSLLLGPKLSASTIDSLHALAAQLPYSLELPIIED